MTQYLTIYIFFYTITLISLQYLVKTIFDNKLSFTTIPHMMYYISNFSKLKYTYWGLMLALTGIPPFLLFFVKFNYLVETLSHLNFFLFILVFLILLLNMLFYIQFVLTKNLEFNISVIKLKKKKINHNVLYLINFMLLLFFLSIFFVFDMLIILNLFI